MDTILAVVVVAVGLCNLYCSDGLGTLAYSYDKQRLIRKVEALLYGVVVSRLRNGALQARNCTRRHRTRHMS